MARRLLLSASVCTVAAACLSLSVLSGLTASQHGDVVPSVISLAVAGDSFSKGFNANDLHSCAFSDFEHYNWATSDTHGASWCSAGTEGVSSVVERLECIQQRDVITADPNHARSGARMLTDFRLQASSIAQWISSQPAPRKTVVLIGHGDVFGGFSCGTSGDQDSTYTCHTTPAAFEREFRKGLEYLISVPDHTIGVLAPIRITQLCRNCPEDVLGPSYETLRMYRGILQRVTIEYSSIPVGGSSRIVSIGGEMVGGGTKAVGTLLIYSDAFWNYRFTAREISRCDRIHPSAAGHSSLARIAHEGLTCSAKQPCCRDTGDPTADGKCSVLDTVGTYYPGIF